MSISLRPEVRSFGIPAVAGLLVLVFWLQILNFTNRESPTFDEVNHIYTGYMSLMHGDYGLNPEHPPLAKAFDALPLLAMHLPEPRPLGMYFKSEAYFNGSIFLYGPHTLAETNAIVGRARLAASLFAVLLAIIAFAFTRELFGTAAGLIALTLLAFEPNVLGHGGWVTTDVPVSCFLLAGVFFFYRFCAVPSWPRLVVAGLAAGLALSTKHSAILLFPMLIVLGLIVMRQKRKVWPMLGGLAAIVLISVVVLWAGYRFRFDARPAGLTLNPPISAALNRLAGADRALIGWFAEHQLLPESYLFGLADVRSAGARGTFIFGQTHPHGVWYYFPAVLLIKSTLPFLVLLIVSVVVVVKTRRLEYAVPAIPAAIYLAAAMSAGLDIGARHILPVWIFCIVLCAGVARTLMERGKPFLYAGVAVLALHAVSTLYAGPNYLAYSNELWGGPAKTWQVLSDSNADWAQQLKQVSQYLRDNKIQNCWYAAFSPLVNPRRYGIPCRPLPTEFSKDFGLVIEAPPEIDGTLLVNATIWSAYYLGSDQLSPYRQLRHLKPKAVIDDGVLVYEGRFAIPLAAAWTPMQRAAAALLQNRREESLEQARRAIDLAPDSLECLIQLGDSLAGSGAIGEAREAYQKALIRADAMDPEVRSDWRMLVAGRLHAIDGR